MDAFGNSFLGLFVTLAVGCGDAKTSASVRVGLSDDPARGGDSALQGSGGASTMLTGAGGDPSVGGDAASSTAEVACDDLSSACPDGLTCIANVCSAAESTLSSRWGTRRATGGTTAIGGTKSTGGVAAITGGTKSTGGTAAITGGTKSAGGTAAITGGTKSTGGTAAITGGTKSTGGSSAKGGTKSTGGSSAKGGTASTGGTPSVSGGSTQTSSTSTTAAGTASTGGSTGAVGAGTDVPAATDPVVSLVLEGNDKMSGRAVSGHWTAAGSPYRVKDNILVAKGTSLTIDPGTKVVFQGRYWFRVFGAFHAVGTSTQRIVFTTTDADIARGDNWVGWRGIRICGDDYDKTVIDHGTEIYNFQFCEIAYVDKNDDVGVHPWERTLGSFYVHGASNSDFIFNDNWIHHGRSGLFAYYGAYTSVLVADPYFYRNVFETASVQAILQVAHVYQASEVQVSGQPNYFSTHFVGGALRNFTGTPQYSTVVDTWDTPVNLDGVEITSCGDQANWYEAWNPNPPNYARVTYTAP